MVHDQPPEHSNYNNGCTKKSSNNNVLLTTTRTANIPKNRYLVSSNESLTSDPRDHSPHKPRHKLASNKSSSYRRVASAFGSEFLLATSGYGSSNDSTLNEDSENATLTSDRDFITHGAMASSVGKTRSTDRYLNTLHNDDVMRDRGRKHSPLRADFSVLSSRLRAKVCY